MHLPLKYFGTGLFNKLVKNSLNVLYGFVTYYEPVQVNHILCK